MLGAATPRAIRLALGLLAAWFLADLTFSLARGDGEVTQPARLVYDAMLLLAAAVTAARRSPGAVLAGAGMAAWAVGDTYYTAVYWGGSIPSPSPADLGWLALPPLVAAGLLANLRRRGEPIARAELVDGATAALAVAAVGAALIFRPVREATEGDSAAVATTLAYPLMDLVLLAVCAGALATRRWSLDRGWTLWTAGVLAFTLADALYLVEVAAGGEATGSWFDSGWSLGMVLWAFAAWQPPARRRASGETALGVAMPLAFAGLALALLTLSGFTAVEPLAVALAAVALATTFARLLSSLRDNRRLLAKTRTETMTDDLTGLGNRRALARDLAGSLQPGAGAHVLVLADLDGFKTYNDTFGHPAGDALLHRLAARLAAAVERRGGAYRMGGDEFCVLLAGGADDARAALLDVRAALAERGDGFDVGCSAGVVLIPEEAATSEQALRIADRRLYACKSRARTSAERQSRDVLLRALVERSPELVEHCDGVATLAEAVARRLGLDGRDAEEVRLAADLHDVGKVAVPDQILGKPGPLDEHEWAFIRQHTIIGERILAAAPALAGVARLVRSTHERWDGAGYPDGLVAEAIPLGARIIAVADAYDAMVADRPYEPARTAGEALAELRRCARTQFDPRVVDAFCAEIGAGGPGAQPRERRTRLAASSTAVAADDA